MALTERSRHKLYEIFADVVGDEKAVEEMLSYFPARDVEEPVTREFLRAEMGDLRVEVGELRSDVRLLRAELHVEIAGVRTELHQMARTMQTWTVGTGISLAGLMLAMTRFG